MQLVFPFLNASSESFNPWERNTYWRWLQRSVCLLEKRKQTDAVTSVRSLSGRKPILFEWNRWGGAWIGEGDSLLPRCNYKKSFWNYPAWRASFSSNGPIHSPFPFHLLFQGRRQRNSHPGNGPRGQTIIQQNLQPSNFTKLTIQPNLQFNQLYKTTNQTNLQNNQQ